MMNEKIKRVKDRINWLKTQITMSGYYDGWTLNGFRKELSELIGKLSKLK